MTLTDQPRSPRWQVAGISAALVILVFIVFGQTLGYGFVNYDDDRTVVGVPEVTGGISLHGIAWAFTHIEVNHWDPLTMISHMADCQLYGLWAGGHHLTNVLLHAAAAVLLFLLLLEMTEALWRCAFVAAVWAIHPLRVESVAWVTERKDVLSGVFFMLTLLAYLRYVRRPESKLRYCIVVLLFVLGLLSKSMLMTLPCVMLLLDYWPLKRWIPGQTTDWRTAWPLVVEKIPLLLISMIIGVVEIQGARHYFVPLAKAPESQRATDALAMVLVYLEQLVWPVHLAVLYIRPAGGLPVVQLVLAIAVMALVSIAAILSWKKRPWLVTGWLWYLGMLIPVIGLFQSDHYPQDDRYTYLPHIGLCIAGTWLAADWAGQRLERRAVLATIASAILCSLVAAAWNQTTYWKDSESLWIHTLACTQGNAIAHLNYGNVLFQQQRIPAAVAEYHEALTINPSYAEAHADLGNVLLQQGRTSEAIAEYRQAVQMDPSVEQAQYDLGLVLLQQGQVQEAIPYFREAVRINPSYAKAHNDLGNALVRLGRPEEAIPHFQEAFQIDPAFADAHNDLGLALFQLGRPQEAIAEYREALRIDPANGNAQYNLGTLLLAQGDAAGALDLIQKAHELQPANPAIQNALAWILATAPQASLRDGPRAVQLAAQASQSGNADNPIALRTLAAAYAQSGQFPNAVQTAQKALQISQSQSNSALAGELQREINLYQAGHSFEEVH